MSPAAGHRCLLAVTAATHLLAASSMAAEPAVPRREPDQAFSLPWDATAWGDVDQDGIPDPLLVERTSGVVQVWPSSLGSDEPVLWTFDGECGAAQIVAAATPGPDGLQVAVFRSSPSETTEYVVDPVTLVPRFAWSAPAWTAWWTYIGDIDGDGVEELGSASRLHLSSEGAIVALPSDAYGAPPVGVVGVGDLDGDGLDDLITQYSSIGFRIEAHLGSDQGVTAEPLWAFDAEPEFLSWTSIGRSIARIPGSDRLVVTVSDDNYCCHEVVRLDVLGDLATPAPTVVQSITDWSVGDGALVDPLQVYVEEVGPPSLVLARGGGLTWFAWDPVLDLFDPLPFAIFEANEFYGGWTPGPITGAWSMAVNEDGTVSVWGWTSPGGSGPIPVAADDPRLEACAGVASGTTGSEPGLAVPDATSPATSDRARSGCGCGTAARPGAWLLLPALVLARSARRRGRSIEEGCRRWATPS
jgi:hypothetical protein